MTIRSSVVLLLLLTIAARRGVADRRRCAMRGVCGQRGHMHQNCPYNGPPKPLDDPHDGDLLRQLCPHLYQGQYTLFCSFLYLVQLALAAGIPVIARKFFCTGNAGQ